MASSSSTAKRSGSDLTEHIPKRAKQEESNSREQEETHFSELVNITLATIITLKKVSKDDIIEAKKEISEAFTKFKFHEIDLSQWNYSSAYFYRHGVHGAGLTRCKVIKALQHCQDFSAKFEPPTLNILSFGGGPGNDIVGFCSALGELNVRGKNLKITVTDLFREWSLYVNLLNVFIKEGNFGKVSELFRSNKTNMCFLKAPPVGRPGSPKYLNALKNADVVLMVKVLSIVEIDERDKIVESLYNGMKEGAFLIFIDSPYDKTLWSEFECLYMDGFVLRDDGLYLGDEQNKYFSSATSNILYSDDRIEVPSKAGVVVLRK